MSYRYYDKWYDKNNTPYNKIICPFILIIIQQHNRNDIFHITIDQHQEIEDMEPESYTMPFFVLTNQQKTKGAVMAVSPKTMDRITAKFGDVYVIPSSVHETLIVPKDAVDDVGQLEKMVRDVNASEVSPEDQLSNHIYEYDSETHTLKIAIGDQTESMSQDDGGDSGPDDGGNAKEREKDGPDENQDEGPRMAM